MIIVESTQDNEHGWTTNTVSLFYVTRVTFHLHGTLSCAEQHVGES